ncbi:uncharacterized protein LOC143373941 [Andrena cerasifolii]|uniref:uncharacterized protein LOC143373941 n=1 Tax=Andrena cerasifolii TaxID=2819439 RepID=UPI004037DCF0
MSENEASPSASVASETLKLEFLIKLIPDAFDGDRYRLRSFIKQVDSVFELAKQEQEVPLLLYVKSKIVGKAREQIDIHCNLTTWPEISELLISLYQDKKTLDQLFEELHSIRQEQNESVTQFYQRLEDLSSRILGTLHAVHSEDTTLSGRLAMVNDMALNRFIYHTHPQISQMLRYREFKSVNNAFTAAVAKEKALCLRYDNNQFLRCKICLRTNHSTKDCRAKKQYPTQNRVVNYNAPSNRMINPQNYNNNFQRMRSSPSSSAYTNSNSTSNLHSNRAEVAQGTIQCNYCKKFGHSIQECRKRQYNNSRQQIQTSQTSTPPTNTGSVNFQNQNFYQRGHNPKPPNSLIRNPETTNSINQVTQMFNEFLR